MPLAALRSVTRKLAVVTFLALVLLPVFLFGYDGPWLAPGDISIRPRAPFPARLAPGALRDIDEWFVDRVGFRYPLIWAGTSLHVGVLRRPIDRHIVFGRDGWMYWTDDRQVVPASTADSRGKLYFSASDVQRIDAQIRAIRDRFAACGLPVAIVITPIKQSLYGEFLINTAHGAPRTRLDALLDQLSEPARTMIVDPRPRMRAAKAVHAPVMLYNKTETHWNDLGAFYGYLATITELARLTRVPALELASLDRYNVHVAPYPGGDMATRVLFSPWRFADENVSLRPKEPIAGAVEVMLDQVHFVHRNPGGKGRLLLFGDSFAMQLIPFLGQHFAEVHRWVGARIDGTVVARVRPDVVLFQTVESETPRLLAPHVNLGSACGA
jgi:alginate O-acetyltransferase complex protein AlgJ